MAGHDVTERWNHNIHYHPVILDAVPPGVRYRRHLMRRYSLVWTKPSV